MTSLGRGGEGGDPTDPPRHFMEYSMIVRKGQVVQWQSMPTKMTVEEVNESDALCVWFRQGTNILQRAWFPVRELAIAEPIEVTCKS